jgi:hypothetical protein
LRTGLEPDTSQKKRPRARGLEFQQNARAPLSEPKIRQISVARGDDGVRHQDAIDHGQQAAENALGGAEAKRGSLGHFLIPFVWVSGTAVM